MTVSSMASGGRTHTTLGPEPKPAAAAKVDAAMRDEHLAMLEETFPLVPAALAAQKLDEADGDLARASSTLSDVIGGRPG